MRCKYIGVEGRAPNYPLSAAANGAVLKPDPGVRPGAGRGTALYAARETEQGYAFTEEHPWEKNLPPLFPYEKPEPVAGF